MTMAAPIIYLDRSEIRSGRLEEAKRAFADLAEFVESNEPGLLTYAVYFSDDGARSSVLHVHRDEASLRRHMEVIGPRLAPFAELLELREIEVFGEISPELSERLTAKLRLLGTEGLLVRHASAGFLRAPPPSEGSSG